MTECLRCSLRLVMFEGLQRTNLREILRLLAMAGYTTLHLTVKGA